MKTEEARRTLGLDPEAGPGQIDAAYTRLRLSVQSKRDQAPTPALRRKCDERLAALDEARAMLRAETAAGSAGPGAGSSGDSSALRDRARRLLGVVPGADMASIDAAYARHRSSVQTKRDQAPTPALKSKCDERLAALDEARAVLRAEAAVADSGAARPGTGTSGDASAMRDRARRLLDVAPGADVASIDAAYARLRLSEQTRRDQAPTAALKSKCDERLAALDEARALLRAEAAAAVR